MGDDNKGLVDYSNTQGCNKMMNPPGNQLKRMLKGTSVCIYKHLNTRMIANLYWLYLLLLCYYCVIIRNVILNKYIKTLQGLIGAKIKY